MHAQLSALALARAMPNVRGYGPEKHGLNVYSVQAKDMRSVSEFADEYGDWLSGESQPRPRARWLERTLAEIPWEAPLCVAPEMPVAEVILLMQKAHRRAALVIHAGKVAGIFTEHDVLTRIAARDMPAAEPVAALMTRDPHLLTEQTEFGAALRILALGSYHHLPVMDGGGRPIGLVSLQTIVAFLVEQFPNEILNAPPDHENFPPAEGGG